MPGGVSSETQSNLMSNPKVFISYSWTSPEREAWVLDLATQLRGAGVNAVLDKWDLKEGQDANAFMVMMVNDPSVERVIIVADRRYVEKANSRTGGVGTETQIISAQVYSQVDQTKFVVLPVEHGDDGKPCVPAYASSRVFIDFTDTSDFNERFDQLLRWIFNKPLHVRPPLGAPPDFEHGRGSASEAQRKLIPPLRRALEILSAQRDRAKADLEGLLDEVSGEWSSLDIPENYEDIGDAVYNAIEEYLPVRDHLIRIFWSASRVLQDDDLESILRRFVERIAAFSGNFKGKSSYNVAEHDHFKFFLHELFLYICACLIKNQRFAVFRRLNSEPYYAPLLTASRQQPMVSHIEFRTYLRSLAHRNERYNLRRLSHHADILKQRAYRDGVNFEDVLQADFILYLNSILLSKDDMFMWWPETGIFATHRFEPFELFARASTERGFGVLKQVLPIESKADLGALIEGAAKKEIPVPTWQYERLNLSELMSYRTLFEAS